MFSMYCILSQHIHVPGYTLHGHIQNVLYMLMELKGDNVLLLLYNFKDLHLYLHVT